VLENIGGVLGCEFQGAEFTLSFHKVVLEVGLRGELGCDTLRGLFSTLGLVASAHMFG